MKIPLYLTILCAVAILVNPFCMIANAEENVGQTSQPLVGGPPIDQQTRRELGLVVVFIPTAAPAAPGTLFPGAPGSGSCSAAFLNDFWAITASHCIEDATSPNQITLQAEWAGKKETRKVSKYQSFEWTHNLDIALLMIDTPFSGRDRSASFPQLNNRPTSDLQGQRIESFGRGLNTLAFQSPAGPMPTTGDGLFRSSDFEVFETSEKGFVFRSVKDSGTAILGGDSGGPSYFRVWDDPNSPNRKIVRLLAGVHASCNIDCLEGQSCPPSDAWTWTKNVRQCRDASVETILNEIQARIAFVPEQPYVERPLDTDLVVNKDTGVKPMPSEETKRAVRRRASDEAVQAAPSANVKKYMVASSLFNGTWTTNSGGRTYTITFTQNGSDVNASYANANGTATGTITGTVTDRSLAFRWTEGGQTGTGKFNLSGDGNTFDGWYNYSDDPNVVYSSWTGTRN